MSKKKAKKRLSEIEYFKHKRNDTVKYRGEMQMWWKKKTPTKKVTVTEAEMEIMILKSWTRMLLKLNHKMILLEYNIYLN